MHLASWAGIVFCISQSAMFSGLNLAFFSLTRLRLEIEAEHKNKNAIKVLTLSAPEFKKKEIIENDVILLWSDRRKQIITASDIFGRLMRGITDHIIK
ncbi:MAG TPA: DUF21 domain-containing protein [bacterium]|nr:DUF21 domain-containing protein [bacterium]